ncbi:hypothetical protein [uncultured Kordia sp.]|uniref:hypothetical protein n=1 Tax=uncultured Kordia sp. TaxID=507699 RepID=UPI002610EA5C|nr:hypothetical protein [uncultured Kordia sp.]
MKPSKTYLKGKSVFIVSLLVIIVTALTVYFSGINSHRSITNNFYISLGIIAVVLFVFLSYGLYKGISIEDNFPKLKGFEFKKKLSEHFQPTDMSGISVGDGIEGVIVSIVLWILISIALIVLFIVLETVVWFSVALLLTMLYWVFFRALRLVFSKAAATENNLLESINYAFSYTILYVGWMFGIVYATTLFK